MLDKMKVIDPRLMAKVREHDLLPTYSALPFLADGLDEWERIYERDLWRHVSTVLKIKLVQTYLGISLLRKVSKRGNGTQRYTYRRSVFNR